MQFARNTWGGGETTCGVNARVPIDQQAEVKPAFPYCMSEREASSKEKICLCWAL